MSLHNHNTQLYPPTAPLLDNNLTTQTSINRQITGQLTIYNNESILFEPLTKNQYLQPKNNYDFSFARWRSSMLSGVKYMINKGNDFMKNHPIVTSISSFVTTRLLFSQIDDLIQKICCNILPNRVYIKYDHEFTTQYVWAPIKILMASFIGEKFLHTWIIMLSKDRFVIREPAVSTIILIGSFIGLLDCY